MARPTFDQLKMQVAASAEETGTLPPTVNFDGTPYTLHIPPEIKLEAIQAVRNPSKLDSVLDQASFAGPDGSQIQH